MYDEVDVDTTFHIPVYSVVKAAVEEAKERKAEPVILKDQTPASPTPSTTISVAQTTPVQTVPASSFVPVQYATVASYDDKKLYAELSAVSDEVIACRKRILDNVY